MILKAKPLLSYVSSFSLGVIFLLSSFSKMEDLEEFNKVLLGVNIIPNLAGGLLTFIVPGLELTLGFCLTLRIMLYESAIMAVLLLTIFLFFGIYMNIGPNPWTCPCFKIGLPIWFSLNGWQLSLRDLLFLVPGIYLLANTSSKPLSDPKLSVE